MRTRSSLLALAVVLSVTSLAVGQETMRADCLEGETSGACFIEADFTTQFFMVDDEGDAWMGSLPWDINDFIMENPGGTEGERFIHIQAHDAEMLACKDFPACTAPGGTILVGTGNWITSGVVSNPGLVLLCPGVTNVSGILADPATGERYKVNVSLIWSADSDNCGDLGAGEVYDISIRKIH